jgi:hypothetical protein
MPKSNAAARLYTVTRGVHGIDANTLALDGWAVLLNVTTEESVERSLEIVRLLSFLYEQVETVERELKRKGFDNEAYVPTLANVRASLAITALGGIWGNIRSYYTPEVLTALKIYPGILSEEDELEHDDLDAILSQIEVLRQRVEASDLPQQVKDFLYTQLELVSKAVREYPVRGTVAFREASDTAAYEWLKNYSEMLPYKDAPEVQEVGQVWSKLARTVKNAVVIGGFATAFLGGVDTALDVAEKLHLLPPAVEQEAHPPEKPYQKRDAPRIEE